MMWRTAILCSSLVGCAAEKPLERVDVPMTLGDIKCHLFGGQRIYQDARIAP